MTSEITFYGYLFFIKHIPNPNISFNKSSKTDEQTLRFCYYGNKNSHHYILMIDKNDFPVALTHRLNMFLILNA